MQTNKVLRDGEFKEAKFELQNAGQGDWTNPGYKEPSKHTSNGWAHGVLIWEKGSTWSRDITEGAECAAYARAGEAWAGRALTTYLRTSYSASTMQDTLNGQESHGGSRELQVSSVPVIPPRALRKRG